MVKTASRVSTYMSSPVIMAHRTDSLAHVRNLMIRHKIGKVVITDAEGRRVEGIVSKSDFVRVVYNKKRYVKPLSNIMAYEIMSSPVYAIPPGRTIKSAAHAMIKRKIGSLLVIEGSALPSGIITKADLVRAYSEKYVGRFQVKDFMNDKPPTVHPTHSLYYVIDLMNESGIGKVVVCEGGKVVGVITKSDVMFLNLDTFLRRRVKYYKRMGVVGRGFEGVVRFYTMPLAGDLMTPDPITVGENEDLAMAADVMVKNGVGTLPVTDEEGNLRGLLTKYDVLRALRKV
ncbi:MAG: CBS domain-containing protein [Desulfurococcales archaeon]|nr:CBS domain-containing protein [Desulfurococcales archaeon]